MKLIALQKNVRQSPRKVRLVANQVKDLELETALRQLAVIERKASLVILKVMKQAIANAMNNHQLPFDQLAIKSIEVTPGATYKRWNAVSRGRAHEIMKRTCHVKIELETKQAEEKKAEAKKPAKAEAKPVAKKTAKAEAKPAAKKTAVKKVKKSSEKK